MENAEIAEVQNETVADTALENKKDKPRLKLSRGGVILSVAFIISYIGLFGMCYRYNMDGKYTLKDIAGNLYTVISVAVLIYLFFYLKRDIWLRFNLRQSHFKTLCSVVFFFGFVNILFAYCISLDFVGITLFLVSTFSLFVLSYCFTGLVFGCIKKFWNETTKLEKILFASIFAGGAIISSIVFILTTAFHNPPILFNSIFSFDIGSQYRLNNFVNIFYGENDSRHLLLAFAQMPFAVLPFLISRLFPMIDGIYGLFVTFAEIAALSWCIIKIMQLLKVNDGVIKILLAITLAFSSTILINMVVVEKYALAMFYAILTITLTMEHSNFKWVSLLLAIGIATTHVFLLPVVLFYEKKPFKQYVLDLVKFGIFAFLFLMLTAQFNLVRKILGLMGNYRAFSGVYSKYSVPQKIAQTFIVFFNCVFMPLTPNDSVWQVEPSFDATFYIGVIIFIICVVGFILNRKDKYARICGYWLLFVVFLHGLLGWGSRDNEMFIFSSLYAFAIYSLIFMFFKSIIKNKKVAVCVMAAICVAVIAFNSYEFIRIVQISMKNFPR